MGSNRAIVDPVCGRRLEQAVVEVVIEGRKQHFCSQGCAVRFGIEIGGVAGMAPGGRAGTWGQAAESWRAHPGNIEKV